MRKKRDWLFSLAGISICVIGILLRVFGDSANQKISYQEGQQMFFAIAPHFTIQPKSIERFYRTLKSIYAIDDEVNIVLISPDHFSANKESIAALCHDTKQFCYDDICLPMKAFPQTKISGCLAETGTKEHGL